MTRGVGGHLLVKETTHLEAKIFSVHTVPELFVDVFCVVLSAQNHPMAIFVVFEVTRTMIQAKM